MKQDYYTYLQKIVLINSRDGNSEEIEICSLGGKGPFYLMWRKASNTYFDILDKEYDTAIQAFCYVANEYIARYKIDSKIKVLCEDGDVFIKPTELEYTMNQMSDFNDKRLDFAIDTI